LTVEQILPLERMAQKSADNLVKGVEDSKHPFERLYALGIRYVGETVEISKHYKNIDALRQATLMDLVWLMKLAKK
jgi:DNA ligase (NAD+)